MKKFRTTKGFIDLDKAYIQAHHQRTPMVYAEDRRKYCSVTWNCDGMYPYRVNSKTLEGLSNLVRKYSLGNACYGPSGGTIVKVRIEESDALMDELEEFINRNVEAIPWP